MKKLQNGRSMIEMLGVLAIIGVLSIGGLAGYTMAMNRHRANQILDYVSRCGVAAQTYGMGDHAFAGTETCHTLMGEAAPTTLSDADCKVSGSGTAAAPHTVTIQYAAGLADGVKNAVVARTSSAIGGATITAGTNGASFVFNS